MSASTNDIPQGQPSELSDSKNVTSESPRPNNSVQGNTLSAAEQILAGVHNYFPPAYLNPNTIPQLHAMNNRQEMEKFSRSMTSLGLAHTIPEEPTEIIEEENVANLLNANKNGSKSAIDLAGFCEEDAFGISSEGMDMDKSNHALNYGYNNMIAAGQGQNNFTNQNVAMASATAPMAPVNSFPLQVSATPTRTIIISNVPISLPDESLYVFFQAFGEIQSLKMDYKMQTIVLVSYYDLRSSQNARQQLNGVALGNQLISVQYLSPMSMNNFGEGMVLLYNLDAFMDDAQKLASVMSTYGEVKSIRDVPDKENYKLVEYYDIRHASAAMTDIKKLVAAASHNASISSDLTHSADMQLKQNDIFQLSKTPSQEIKDNLSQSWDGSADIAERMKLITDNNTISTPKHISTGSNASNAGSEVGNMIKSSSVGCALSNAASNVTVNANTPTRTIPTGGAMPLTPSIAKALNLLDVVTNNNNMAQNTNSSGISIQNQSSLLDTSNNKFSKTLMPNSNIMQNNTHDPFLQKNLTNNLFSALSGYPPGFQNQQQTNYNNLFNSLSSRGSSLSNSTSVGTGLDIYCQQQQYPQNVQTALLQNLANQQAAAAAAQVPPPINYSTMNPFQGYFSNPSSILNANPQLSLLAQQQSTPTQQNCHTLTQQQQQQQQQHLPNTPSSSTNALPLSSNMTPAMTNTNNSSSATIEALTNRLKDAGLSTSTDVHQRYVGHNATTSNTTTTTPISNSNISLAATQLVAQQILQQKTASNRMSTSAMPSPGLGHKSASSPSLNQVYEETHHRPRGGGRLCRPTLDPMVEAERRQQQQRLYALDLDKIKSGEDVRTTLMIKNIPNKYTQKMLLASVDETLKGKYDFFYLPIDFKNKCNVGYGFINMREPADIIPVVQRFHDKKWERFNSEKICNVAYARIQGKQALINHFQNSSLMHEDKKHRPVLFVTEGPNKGEPEVFPVGPNVRPKITVKERDFRSRERSNQWS